MIYTTPLRGRANLLHALFFTALGALISSGEIGELTGFSEIALRVITMCLLALWAGLFGWYRDRIRRTESWRLTADSY